MEPVLVPFTWYLLPSEWDTTVISNELVLAGVILELENDEDNEADIAPLEPSELIIIFPSFVSLNDTGLDYIFLLIEGKEVFIDWV